MSSLAPGVMIKLSVLEVYTMNVQMERKSQVNSANQQDMCKDGVCTIDPSFLAKLYKGNASAHDAVFEEKSGSNNTEGPQLFSNLH